MPSKTIENVDPKAVMTPEELERWKALPPEQQLAQLRAAIERGVASGASNLSMDEIWEKARARHSSAKV